MNCAKRKSNIIFNTNDTKNQNADLLNTIQGKWFSTISHQTKTKPINTWLRLDIIWFSWMLNKNLASFHHCCPKRIEKCCSTIVVVGTSDNSFGFFSPSLLCKLHANQIYKHKCTNGFVVVVVVLTFVCASTARLEQGCCLIDLVVGINSLHRTVR